MGLRNTLGLHLLLRSGWLRNKLGLHLLLRSGWLSEPRRVRWWGKGRLGVGRRPGVGRPGGRGSTVKYKFDKANIHDFLVKTLQPKTLYVTTQDLQVQTLRADVSHISGQHNYLNHHYTLATQHCHILTAPLPCHELSLH